MTFSTEGEGIHEREESPTYLVEHLATFTVSKETGIVYPADGMRRLLQLEKTNGIWSQKMQLRLDKNLVLIIDNETGVRLIILLLKLIFQYLITEVIFFHLGCDGEVSCSFDPRAYSIYKP